MLRAEVLVLAIAALSCGGDPKPAGRPSTALPPVRAGDLRRPEAFDTIGDREERSRALFLEASKVLFHPRCANCHPAGDTPAQGDARRAHDPPVVRGPGDRGIAGLECESCHQDRNLELARVPGAPGWHLAPIEMAWIGRTARAVCEQIKDPKRNGGKTLDAIVEHSAHDRLVAWGWEPGHDRVPAPGTQERFGALMAAWVREGAACPREEAPR